MPLIDWSEYVCQTFRSIILLFFFVCINQQIKEQLLFFSLAPLVSGSFLWPFEWVDLDVDVFSLLLSKFQIATETLHRNKYNEYFIQKFYPQQKNRHDDE